MAASVLYFGTDECNRVQVLRTAGYSVLECNKIDDLKLALNTSPQPSAVLIRCSGRCKPAIKIIHTAALAPVIVFPNPDNFEIEESVDLVVPPLTPPAKWLRELAKLIEKSRALKKGVISLQETSATLIDRSIAIKAQSAANRANSALSRERRTKQRNRSNAHAPTGNDVNPKE